MILKIDILQYIIFQGLAKYTDLFLRHEIDIQTFSTLTEQDLKEIGITTFGARKKLLYISNGKLYGMVLFEVKMKICEFYLSLIIVNIILTKF